MTEENVLRFKDPRRGKEIALYYRDPAVEDWIAYWAERAAGYKNPEKQAEGEQKKVDDGERRTRLEWHFRVQFEFGKRILTGFSASTEILADISTGDPEWKEKLGRKIPQLIITLGSKAFAEEDLEPEKNS